MNENANDPHRYDDMLDMSHHISRTHPQMPPENRAAQFAPFAALTGYGDEVKETARLTDQKLELDDDQKLVLNGKLQMLLDGIDARTEAAITYFQPDAKKAGGAYITAKGCVKKVDVYERRIVMTSDLAIPVDDVIAIDAEAFGFAEETNGSP